MELNRIFRQPVNRPIEGVIKADDETSLYVELSEYFYFVRFHFDLMLKG